jgi:transcriptional antiterminator RfaH
MPFLQHEPSAFPDDLFSSEQLAIDPQSSWWCFTTHPRAEKAVARRLYAQRVPFFCPTIIKRFRSPSGRLRQSYVPLFPGYLFVAGDESHRLAALQTNKLSRCQLVVDREQLVHDLRAIHRAIELGVPLTPESRIVAGDQIRVRSGPFAGYEGHVLRREGKSRLLLAIKFIEQGVSMEIDEALLEKC